jgi:hypothetical protein
MFASRESTPAIAEAISASFSSIWPIASGSPEIRTLVSAES